MITILTKQKKLKDWNQKNDKKTKETIIMAQHDKIVLKNTDENNMSTTIELDKLNKTSVKWGLDPEKTEYVGKINIKDLEEKEE